MAGELILLPIVYLISAVVHLWITKVAVKWVLKKEIGWMGALKLMLAQWLITFIVVVIMTIVMGISLLAFFASMGNAFSALGV